MKASQVHDLTNEELKERLVELKADLFKLRFNHATSQLGNPNLIPACKRDIARVLTVLRDREVKGITGPVKVEKAEKPVKKAKKA
jgi:large subunit ribosomal protein L29